MRLQNFIFIEYFDLYKFHHWRTIYVLWNKIVIFFDVITHKNFLDSLSNLTCSRNNTFVWMAGSAVSPIQEENDEKKKKMSFSRIIVKLLRNLQPTGMAKPILQCCWGTIRFTRIWILNIWKFSELCRTIRYNNTDDTFNYLIGYI